TAFDHTMLFPLSLHDALPILTGAEGQQVNIDATVNPPDIPDVSGGTVEYDSVVEPPDVPDVEGGTVHYRSVVDPPTVPVASGVRSEEHTSELQSRFDLVCRLL